MYNNLNYQVPKEYYYSLNNKGNYQPDERIIGGGFAAPFLLGGLTGIALTPYFTNRPQYGPPYNNYYNYYNYPPYYYRQNPYYY